MGVLRLCAPVCVPLVSSYSGPGLNPARDAGGWWASRPHLTRPPTSVKLRETLRSWGGVFRNRREEHTGNKPCLGMWRGSLGRRLQRIPEHCNASSDSVLQRLPLGFYSQITWDRKHLLLETRIDDFLTSRLLYLNRTNKADVFIQMVGDFRGLSSSIGF